MEKSYRFIAWFFVLIFLIEIAGFFNSYFSKFPRFEGWLSVHHLHLLSLFLWFVMLFVQPVFIYRRQFAAHRAVGKASYFLIPVITILSLNVMKFSYNKAVAAGIPDSAARAFLWVSFSALVPFLIIYILAIVYRKVPAAHMRYMIATAVALLGPALGRINFGMKDLNSAILFAFAVADMFLVALIIFEYLKGKNYKPYLISLAICVILQAPFPWVSTSTAWQGIAGFFVRFYPGIQ